MKYFLVLSLMLSLAMASSPAPVLAHGHAEHGGEFSEVDEYTFEILCERAGDAANFSLWVKDPALKPVTTGDVTLQLKLSDSRTATVVLKPGAAASAFTGRHDGLRRGRYRASVIFGQKGMKTLITRFSVKVP